MKLVKRERVDGTRVTIGLRAYYIDKELRKKSQNNEGEEEKYEASRCYAAEYRDVDGRQVCRNLRTKSKAKARRMAIEIQQRLESGIEKKPFLKHEIAQLIEQYKEAAKIRGLAPKTISKYKADFEKLERFCLVS